MLAQQTVVPYLGKVDNGILLMIAAAASILAYMLHKQGRLDWLLKSTKKSDEEKPSFAMDQDVKNEIQTVIDDIIKKHKPASFSQSVDPIVESVVRATKELRDKESQAREEVARTLAECAEKIRSI